jgi:hypothetical protein
VDISSRRMEGGSVGRDKRGFETDYLGRELACEYEEQASGLRTMVHITHVPEHIRWGEPPGPCAPTSHCPPTTSENQHGTRAPRSRAYTPVAAPVKGAYRQG